MRTLISLQLCLLLLCSHWAAASPELQQDLEPGHWLSVRGNINAAGVFIAERVELINPQRYQELIGTAFAAADSNLLLLGQTIEIGPETRFDALARDDLNGKRLRVEGDYDSVPFRAREVSSRGPGRDRLVGRIDQIEPATSGTQLSIMGFAVSIDNDISIDVERPVDEYLVDTEILRDEPLDKDADDDLFGVGLRIAPNLRLQGQVGITTTTEDNFNLEDPDFEDRTDRTANLRARLLWNPNSSLEGIVNLRYGKRWRDDQDNGKSQRADGSLGEAMLHWSDFRNTGLELSVGRQDFDDDREWLYDQNLDGVRVAMNGRRVRADLSLTTSLSDADQRDEKATNVIAYLSNNQDGRHLAAYMIRRDIDAYVGAEAELPIHLGVRALGDWLPNSEGWFELAALRGTRGARDLEAWGLDVGNTWELDWPVATYVTLGYAYGSGGRPNEGVDRNFRQTGLQDNNGKWGGVTSFRYYGELAQPELSNLDIMTLGVGWRLAPRTSLDFILHRYRQDQPIAERTESDLGQSTNGVNDDLGWELDVVLGLRRDETWDLELVGGYYKPGAAFNIRDDAFLLKAQIRFRY